MSSSTNQRKHKMYRLHRADVWGALARKQKNNFITNLVQNYAQQDLRQRLKNYPRNERRNLLKTFPKRPFMSYTLTNLTKFVDRNKSKLRGTFMKNRKILSTFYDRRLRAKTWRRLGRLAFRPKTRKPSYAAFLEHRLDVLLIRSCFVYSILTAKQLIRANKIQVYGRQSIRNPGFCLVPFQIFAIKSNNDAIRKRIKMNLYKNTLLCKPSYLWIHYGLLFSFLIENVNPSHVSYPFALFGGYLSAFRKSFNVLYS